LAGLIPGVHRVALSGGTGPGVGVVRWEVDADGVKPLPHLHLHIEAAPGEMGLPVGAGLVRGSDGGGGRWVDGRMLSGATAAIGRAAGQGAATEARAAAMAGE